MKYLKPAMSFFAVWGGYPFRSSGSDDDIRFVKTDIIKHIFGSVSVVGSSLTFWALVLAFHAEDKTIRDFMRVTGYTTTDFVSTGCGILTCLIGCSVIFSLFWKNQNQIIGLHKELELLVSVLGIEGHVGMHTKNALMTRFKRAIVMSLLILAINPAANYFLYAMLFPEDDYPVLKVMYCCGSVLLVAFGFLNPVFAGCLLQSQYFIAFMEGCFICWNDKIISHNNRQNAIMNFEDLEPPSRSVPVLQVSGVPPASCARKEIKEIIDFGMILVKKMKRVNEVLAPFLIVTSSTSLIETTAYAYGVTTLFFCKLDMFRTLLTANFFMMCFLQVYTYLAICSGGQKLENIMRLANDNMHITTRQTLVGMSWEMRADIKYLRSKLRQEKVIAPYQFIGINHAGFLGAIGTIGTYLVVLMQFKASEAERHME